MPSSFELVDHPIEGKLKEVLSAAEQTLFVASPFIKNYGVQTLLGTVRQGVAVKLLTNLDLANICGPGFDVEPLPKLWDKFQVTLSSLGKLHAKVYISDDRAAFLTSANLTRGGLVENYEYGILLTERPLVARMLSHMETYFALGNIFDRAAVEAITDQLLPILDLQKRIERSREATSLRRLLRRKQEALHTALLRNRVRGRTINSIFAETILYLLQYKGPLATEQLHPFIQNVHPDICDDTIDREIDGQRFGKLWKHQVRNAQHFLKGKGLIYLRADKKWGLA